jgi:hypothetical protein
MKPIDWERIERDYRAGVKTLREIASEYGVSHGAINKRAKRDEWARDLAGKVARKADELVSRTALSKQASRDARVAERQIVDANARAIVEIRLSHRKDIALARETVSGLLGELASCAEESKDSILERSRVAKTLSDALSALIDKERQAFNIDARTPESADMPSIAVNFYRPGERGGV